MLVTVSYFFCYGRHSGAGDPVLVQGCYCSVTGSLGQNPAVLYDSASYRNFYPLFPSPPRTYVSLLSKPGLTQARGRAERLRFRRRLAELLIFFDGNWCRAWPILWVREVALLRFFIFSDPLFVIIGIMPVLISTLRCRYVSRR